jgi:hypothetical protein
MNNKSQSIALWLRNTRFIKETTSLLDLEGGVGCSLLETNGRRILCIETKWLK